MTRSSKSSAPVPVVVAAPARASAGQDAALETALGAVESRLASLGDALRSRDLASIDLHSTELHRALSSAVDHFSRAARSGALPPALRRRLVNAGGTVAAQRESLARATAALDRAMDVLLPRETPGLYAAHGSTERAIRSGRVQA
jgi:hypothetical protein